MCGSRMMKMMMLPWTCILLICCSIAPPLLLIEATLTPNLTLPHQHPDPEAVVADVQRRIKTSIARRGRELLDQCQTGNPIDDCWRCDPNWATTNRQKLADCAIGFGAGALGGKGGQIYVVTDSSDLDAAHPTPGTLRFGVIQDEPLWIVFSSSMTIVLKHELIFNSYKTVDGRGALVRITGHGCLTLQYISHVIIHNIQVFGCKPSGNTIVASSPSHAGWRGRSDGDGISIFGSRSLWIDHVTLSNCADGLVDAIMGSTAITVSNCYFSHHDEVMLLGHDDRYVLDSGMQVTIAFNRFGEALVQRMPRCRRGYIHVVNNDFTSWEMYAIGGSAAPTINSQGNRYSAPADPNAKEVTKRVSTDEGEWEGWNWRTDGDIMVNGAFFVPSGEGLSSQYAKASSLEPMSAALADQLTLYAGVIGEPRNDDNGGFNGGGASNSGGTSNGVSTPGGSGYGVSAPDESGGEDDGFFGMIFGSGSPSYTPSPTTILGYSCLYLVIILSLSNVAIDDHVALLLLPSQ